MFDIQTQLFEGKDIRFGPIDHEKDPEIEAKWTHDSDFMRMIDIAPARPISAAMVKKQYEKLEKQIEEKKVAGELEAGKKAKELAAPEKADDGEWEEVVVRRKKNKAEG